MSKRTTATAVDRTVPFLPRLAELMGAWGLVAVMPTLEFFKSDPASLVPLRLGRFELAAYVVLLTLLVPVCIAAIEAAISVVSAGAARLVHATVVALFLGVAAVEFGRHEVNTSSSRAITLGVIVGAIACVCIWRFVAARLFLRFLAVAPCVFGLLFIASPGIWSLGQPEEVAVADVTIPNRPSIMLVVFDELPLDALLDGSGVIDRRRYPAFAELARGATWYRNTSSVAPVTKFAVPAILTGRLPRRGSGAPTAVQYPQSLFTLLGGEYDIEAAETAETMCPTNECGESTSPEGGRRGLLGMARNTGDFLAWFVPASTERSPRFGIPGAFENRYSNADAFLRAIGGAPEGQLAYLHVLLPHQPWQYFAEGRDTGAATEARGTRNAADIWVNDAAATQGRQRMLIQLQAADHLLSKVLDRLRTAGTYDDTMVVVTADHGIGFVAGEPQRGVTSGNFPGLMWIPNMIKFPGQTAGVVDDRPAQSIDIVPTVADALGVDLPWKVDGRSLIGSARPEGPRPVLATAEGDPATSSSGLLWFPGSAGFRATLATEPWAGSMDGSDLWAYGPYGALLGTRVAADSKRPDAGIRWTRGASMVTVAEPAAKRAPWTYVEARLTGVRPGAEIAITVDGVVAGFATAQRDATDGTVGCWAMLDPAAFGAGRNDVRAFVVTGEPGAPELRELRARR